jgi:hypothetical protein
VVEEGDAEEGAGLLESAGDFEVGLGGRGIAGWMVMDDENARRAFGERESEYLTRVHDARGEGPNEEHDVVDDAATRGEHGKNEHFLPESFEARCVEFVRVFRALDVRTRFLTFCPETTMDFKHGRELDCFGLGHALDLHELGWCPFDEAMPSAELHQELICEIERGHAFDAGAEHDGEEFAVGERVGAALEESFARSLVCWEVLDAIGHAENEIENIAREARPQREASMCHSCGMSDIVAASSTGWPSHPDSSHIASPHIQR